MATKQQIKHKSADGKFKTSPASKPDYDPKALAKTSGLKGPKGPKKGCC